MCDVLCIALAELPALLTIQDVVETLLHVKFGPAVICWILANAPDYFWEGNSLLSLIKSELIQNTK